MMREDKGQVSYCAWVEKWWGGGNILEQKGVGETMRHTERTGESQETKRKGHGTPELIASSWHSFL